MDKNLLDNLSGQEIKELIDDEIMNLEELPDSALEKVLNFEIEMLCHGTGDMDIIRQCSEILDKRNKSNKLNEDEISDIINKTKSEHVTVINAENSPSTVTPQRKIRFVLKRIAIAAAAIMIMMTTTIAIAAAFGVDMFKYIRNITGEPDGTTVNVDEFTFYNAGKTKKYDSIQEMVESENLDIMYPTSFPEDTKIRTVWLSDTTNYENVVQIITFDTEVGVQIELNSIELNHIEYSSSSDMIYEHNGLIYYISRAEAYVATCYYNKNTYYISAKNYEDLIFIINNMKE